MSKKRPKGDGSLGSWILDNSKEIIGLGGFGLSLILLGVSSGNVLEAIALSALGVLFLWFAVLYIRARNS